MNDGTVVGEAETLCRVPTQIVFSNSLCFPCPTANFPCANLHNLWLLHTQNWLGRPIMLLEKKWISFAANIAISFTFRFRAFTIWANKIRCVFPVFWQNSLCFPCVLTKFPNSLCFPWQGILGAIFPVFPVPWVPWLWDQVSGTKWGWDQVTCYQKDIDQHNDKPSLVKTVYLIRSVRGSCGGRWREWPAPVPSGAGPPSWTHGPTAHEPDSHNTRQEASGRVCCLCLQRCGKYQLGPVGSIKFD